MMPWELTSGPYPGEARLHRGQGFPGPLSQRWGDYSAAVFDAQAGQIYFANEYIQYPNCTGADFTLTLATCGGTRDGFANWGTSVNAVTP